MGAHSPSWLTGQLCPPTSTSRPRDRPRVLPRGRSDRRRRRDVGDAWTRRLPARQRACRGGRERELSTRATRRKPRCSFLYLIRTVFLKKKKMILCGSKREVFWSRAEATCTYLSRLHEVRLHHLGHTEGAQPLALLAVRPVARRSGGDESLPASHRVRHPSEPFFFFGLFVKRQGQ